MTESITQDLQENEGRWSTAQAARAMVQDEKT